MYGNVLLYPLYRVVQLTCLCSIIKHFITFCKRRNKSWEPLHVDGKTPHNICDFITQKCGRKEEGCEGRKVSSCHPPTVMYLTVYFAVCNCCINPGSPHFLVQNRAAWWECQWMATRFRYRHMVSCYHLSISHPTLTSHSLSHGLPTRSRVVSTFMVGLEKTKAKMGEVLQSAQALTLGDMHRLYEECITPHSKSIADQQWGVIRYVCTHCCIHISSFADR